MKAESPVVPGRELPETIIGEHQPEYQNLPALVQEDGSVLVRFSLDEEEKRFVAEKGYIYFFIYKGKDNPFPPIMPLAEELTFNERGEGINPSGGDADESAHQVQGEDVVRGEAENQSSEVR